MNASSSALLKKHGLRAALYPVFLFLFWLLLFALTPMTEDDNYFWSLRLDGFSRVLDFVLNYGNGRFLGNMGIFYLVEYTPLRILVKALIMSGLCLLLPRLLPLRNPFTGLLTVPLLLSVSPELFSQVYAWTSGFQNFVPPVFLSLLLLLLIRVCLQADRPGLPVKLGLGFALLLLSLAMQLYVEHSSCIHILLLISLLFYSWKKQRKLLYPCVLSLIGALTGLALMFLIPRLSPDIMMDMSAHKSLTFSGGLLFTVVSAAKNGVVLLAKFSENTLALLLLAVLQSVLVWRRPHIFSPRERKALCFLLLAPAFSLSLSLSLGESLSKWYGNVALAESLFLCGLMCLFLIGLGFSTIRLLRRGEKELRLPYFLLAFSVIGLLPCLLINPLVIRMAFHSYVLLSAALLLLLDWFLAEPPLIHRQGIVRQILLLITAAQMLWLTAHFGDIHRMTQLREDYIAEELSRGETQLDYFTIPSDYLFNYYDAAIYAMYYRARYGQELSLHILPAEVWLNEHYYHAE